MSVDSGDQVLKEVDFLLNFALQSRRDKSGEQSVQFSQVGDETDFRVIGQVGGEFCAVRNDELQELPCVDAFDVRSCLEAQIYVGYFGIKTSSAAYVVGGRN